MRRCSLVVQTYSGVERLHCKGCRCRGWGEKIERGEVGEVDDMGSKSVAVGEVESTPIPTGFFTPPSLRRERKGR
jgi:hypothetical protein